MQNKPEIKTMTELMTMALNMGVQLEVLADAMPEPERDESNYRYMVQLIKQQAYDLANEIELTSVYNK